jgi:hypothetical protein
MIIISSSDQFLFISNYQYERMAVNELVIDDGFPKTFHFIIKRLINKSLFNKKCLSIVIFKIIDLIKIKALKLHHKMTFVNSNFNLKLSGK